MKVGVIGLWSCGRECGVMLYNGDVRKGDKMRIERSGMRINGKDRVGMGLLGEWR